MLQHEEQTGQTDGPRTERQADEAAQVRVTAAEFARAVARYQARRDQAAQRMEGTVAIGDAVHELGLEATPEEILTEVQAERAHQIAAQPVARTAVIGPVARMAVIGGVIGLLALMGGGLFVVRGTAPEPPAVTVLPAVQTLPSSLNATAPGRVLVQDTRKSGPVLRTLAEMPDDVPAQCTLDATASHVTFADFTNANAAWTLVKHDGKVYVRGWIAAMSPDAIRISTVSLYSQKGLLPTGASPTAVTLPLDGFVCNPGISADDMISASKVQPDGHFAEKWSPQGESQKQGFGD